MKFSKGAFKNIGKDIQSDATILGGMLGAKYGLSKIPDVIRKADGDKKEIKLSPVMKGAGGYLLTKFLLGGQKGMMADLAMGLRLGCADLAATPIKEKIGIKGMDSSYVAGTEFIRISRKPINKGVKGANNDASYVGGRGMASVL